MGAHSLIYKKGGHLPVSPHMPTKVKGCFEKQCFRYEGRPFVVAKCCHQEFQVNLKRCLLCFNFKQVN